MLPDTNHPRRVVDHVRSLGGLIVVEEIFTGLHRLGPEWGFPLHSIEPDIVVASKALTNGVTPLSCMWAREPLAAPDVFPPGSHSSTFAGNPLALAVVDVVLDRWDRWDQWDRAAEDVDELGSWLAAALHPTDRRGLRSGYTGRRRFGCSRTHRSIRGARSCRSRTPERKLTWPAAGEYGYGPVDRRRTSPTRHHEGRCQPDRNLDGGRDRSIGT